MKFLSIGLTVFLCLTSFFSTFSQSHYPEFSLEQSVIEGHLRFLASDELQGRRTGEAGNNLAARYIASYFQAYGLQPVPGADGYFQRFVLQRTSPPEQTSLSWGKQELTNKDDFLVLEGGAVEIPKGKSVFVGYGTKEVDYEGKNVKGKIMVALAGMPEGGGASSMRKAREIKQQMAKEKGALAVVELYNGSYPWNVLVRFMGRGRTEVVEFGQIKDQAIPHLLLKDSDPSYSAAFKGKKSVNISFSSTGVQINRDTKSQNVAAWVEGTDPELKNEYILLTAHYDHVGTGKNGGQRFTEEDSIFNGARDNGIGTIALLAAAKSLGAMPPKRSVIFLAVTGEEMGLLGSRYYADHPLIPLNQTVFNLNSDNGGYNDTSAVAIMGFDRVGAEKEMEQAANTFGLKVIPDPAPEQNLFDRSDNVAFAAKGVPAPSYGPGMDKMDKEILKYYHQVADEVESLDFAYLLRFTKSYAHAARLIADKAERPRWIEGDKYEAAFKELYGND